MSIKNVYVNENGEINLNKGIGLASLSDLESMLCACGESVEGFVQLEEGIHYWQSIEELEEMAGDDVEVYTGVYHLIDGNVPVIYNHFINQIDPVLEEVITLKLTGENSMLYAVTHQRSSNFYHVHNVWLDENKEVQENCSMLPRMFVDMYKIA